ncbi:hypothetical protein T07_6719 [Trichinella nelsoni]|uniref:Uncharacterized protein n=1 Tax=Trichinella nelsoni TaxID=6336 RepID=A0A0V0RXW3_9BILA|nr:hypothetical protein T07_6719 [Trichinella nelsoni]
MKENRLAQNNEILNRSADHFLTRARWFAVELSRTWSDVNGKGRSLVLSASVTALPHALRRGPHLLWVSTNPVRRHNVAQESEQGLNVRHMYFDFSYSTYMWTVSIGIHSIGLVNGGTTFSRYNNDPLEDQHEHIDNLKEWRSEGVFTLALGNSCMNSRHQSEQSSAVVANNCISGSKVHEPSPFDRRVKHIRRCSFLPLPIHTSVSSAECFLHKIPVVHLTINAQDVAS